MEWIDLVTGAALGTVASTAYFAALALNIRIAHQIERPGAALLCGGGLRIALLLFAGWGTAQLGLWSALGFAAAFPVIRAAVIALARVPKSTAA